MLEALGSEWLGNLRQTAEKEGRENGGGNRGGKFSAGWGLREKKFSERWDTRGRKFLVGNWDTGR